MKDISPKAERAHAWLVSERGKKELDILRSRFPLSDHFNITYAILKTGRVRSPEELIEIIQDISILRRMKRLVRGGLIAIIIALCLTFVACSACTPARPEIHIIGMEVTQGTHNIYTVSYLVNGAQADKSFQTFEEADRYIKYLVELGGLNERFPRFP